MRYVLFFLVLAAAVSCCVPKQCPPVPDPVVLRDTVRIHDTIDNPQLYIQIDALQRQNDSLLIVSDTLAKRLLHSRLTIQNVKYYLNIVNRNPSQLKFLRGWINRALE